MSIQQLTIDLDKRRETYRKKVEHAESICERPKKIGSKEEELAKIKQMKQNADATVQIN